MANNRMYLVYRPTGDAVYLGYRMSRGWSTSTQNMNIQENLDVLFEKASKYADSVNLPEAQDNFCLVMEDAKGVPYVIDNWKYDQNKKKEEESLKLIIGEEVRFTKKEIETSGKL